MLSSTSAFSESAKNYFTLKIAIKGQKPACFWHPFQIPAQEKWKTGKIEKKDDVTPLTTIQPSQQKRPHVRATSTAREILPPVLTPFRLHAL